MPYAKNVHDLLKIKMFCLNRGILELQINEEITSPGQITFLLYAKKEH